MAHEHGTRPARLSRRAFFGESARFAGGCALVGMGLSFYAADASELPADAIRPPGALDEEDFLAACVRCGLCVRDCPYDTLRLAERQNYPSLTLAEMEFEVPEARSTEPLDLGDLKLSADD